MLNSIGERTEPCGTPFFILLSLKALSVAGVHYEATGFDNISMMKRTMCLSGMVLRSFSWSPRCHTVSYAAVKSRNTTQPSHCSESCIRCLVLVVLRGPPLIYHGGSRLVPEEAVGPPQGRCGCLSKNRRKGGGRQHLNGRSEVYPKLSEKSRIPDTCVGYI